jgi:NADP-reducing hydrogenase subunit HndD
VRGLEGIKEASYDLAGLKVNVAVASSASQAKKLLDSIKSGEKNYHFVEIMGCPGGCINGGGQPIVSARVKNFVDVRAERAKALYCEDERKTIRKSHENPAVLKMYKEYFGEFGSHRAHEALHTSYRPRKKKA